MAKESKKVLSEIEKKEWNELYQYVRKSILFYDEKQSLPSSLVLRLKGLTKGKYLDNRNIKDKAKYSYKIVLYAFQICRPAIMSGIAGKEFKNEMGKFNYICKIVENNLNDVYLRVQKSEKSEEKVRSMEIDSLDYEGATYNRKTDEKENKKLDALW